MYRSRRDPDDQIIEYNTRLAKIFSRLKKDAGAATIQQNYRGTGSQKFRRQLWVRFKSGAVIDLWLNKSSVQLGGVVKNRPPGSEAILSRTHIDYDNKTPEQVYEETLTVLGSWANPAQRDRERARSRILRNLKQARARKTPGDVLMRRRRGRDANVDYVLVYGKSTLLQPHQTFKAKQLAIDKAKQLSDPDSYGDRVKVYERANGKTKLIGSSVKGNYASRDPSRSRSRRDPSTPKAEIISISRRPNGTNYVVKVFDPKFRQGYDLVDVLVHDNGARSIRSAHRNVSTPTRASNFVTRYLNADIMEREIMRGRDASRSHTYRRRMR